jgi:hypothetical protein
MAKKQYKALVFDPNAFYKATLDELVKFNLPFAAKFVEHMKKIS